MIRRLSALVLAAFLLSAAAPVAARKDVTEDYNFGAALGWKLYGIPLVPDRATAAVPLQFVTPGAGLLKSTGLNGSVAIAIANTDYLTSSFTLGGQLGGTPASATVLGLRETGGPTLLTIGAIPDGGYTFRVGSTFVGSTTIPSSAITGFQAAWSRTGARVFCVDGVNGNDANLGYADSADTTQGNVATATATCGAAAKQTWAALVAIIPPIGNGRTAYVVINNANASTGGVTTYTDRFDQANQLAGYTTFAVRATGTNTTAGAVAFDGSTNDLAYQGGITATGMFAAGYTIDTGATSDTFAVTKVGGGSPSFPAETAKPYFVRARFDNATTTTAQRNLAYPIVEVVSATQIRFGKSITLATGDKFYLEEQGVVFSSTAVQAFNQTNTTFTIYGVSFGGSLQFTRANATLVWVQTPTANSITATDSTLNILSQSASFIGAPNGTTQGTIGPTRTGSVFLTRASGTTGIKIPNGAFAGGALGTTGNFSSVASPGYTGPGSWCAIGGDWGVNGGAGGESAYALSGAISTANATPGVLGGSNTGTAGVEAPLRVLGTTIFSGGARATIGSIKLQSTSTAFGIRVVGTNDLWFVDKVYGGTKTDAGWDTQQSRNSRISYVDAVSALGQQITGANGDIYFGKSNSVSAGGIYANLADIYATADSLLLPNGDAWTRNHQNSSDANFTGSTATTATFVGNASGGTISGQNFVRSGAPGDANTIQPIKADSASTIDGAIGFLVSTVPNLKGGVAIYTGVVPIPWDSNGFGGGGAPVWISAVDTGKAAFTMPTSPNVARYVGWSIGEFIVTLAGTNFGATPHYVNGVVPTAVGYVKSTANSQAQTTSPTVPWSDITGVPSFVLTSRTLTAGAGMTGGGDLSADRTFNVIANADGTIVVNADDIQAGVMQTANYAARSVTYPKLPSVTASRLLGRGSAGGPGDGQEITLGAGLTMTGTSLDVTSGTFVPAARTLTPGTGILIDGGTVAVDLSANRTLAARIDGVSITSTGGGSLQRAALAGDLSCAAGSNTCALINIPSGTTMAGSLLATAIAAPSTPAAGKGSLYVDSTSKNLAVKDDAGVVKHGVQTATAGAHQFAMAISDAGAVTFAQPAAADISGLATIATTGSASDLTTGTLPAGRFPALSGAVTTSVGSTATAFGALAATSVLANATGSSAVPSALAATTNGDVMRMAGGVLGWGAIPEASVTSLVTDLAGKLADPGNNGAVYRTSSGVTSALNGTTGSVVYFSSAGVLAQDNANFFWDGVNHALGLGGSPPSTDRLFASGRVRFDSSVNVTGVPTDPDHAGLFINGNSSDAQLSFGRDGSLAGSIMGKVGSMSYFAPTGGTKDHQFYFDATTGGARFYASMSPGATNPVVSINPSGVDVAALSAGGIAKASATTGRLGVATLSDIATALSMPTSFRVLAGNGTSGFAASDEIRLDTTLGTMLVSGDGAVAWRNGTAIPGATNYDQVRAFWDVSNAFWIKSEKGGTGTVRAMNVSADTATLTLRGSEVRASTLTAGGYVATDAVAGTGALVNVTPTAELNYMIQLDPTSIANLNIADQYIATSSDTNLYGSTAVEYPTANTVPSYYKIEACIVGTNTITSGEVDVAPAINGAGAIVLIFTSSSTGCQRSAGTNGGAVSTDTVGVQLAQSTFGGRHTAVLTGNFRLAIKYRLSPLSTF